MRIFRGRERERGGRRARNFLVDVLGKLKNQKIRWMRERWANKILELFVNTKYFIIDSTWFIIDLPWFGLQLGSACAKNPGQRPSLPRQTINIKAQAQPKLILWDSNLEHQPY